jgi:hypothetical protein
MDEATEITTELEIKDRGLTLLEQAQMITISNPGEYCYAGEFLVSLKRQEKLITEFFKPIKQKIDESKKIVLEKERDAIKPLRMAQELISPLMLSYERAEQEKARMEAVRLRELALRAEEERILAEALEAEQSGDKFAADEILQEMAEPVNVPTITIQPDIPKINGLGTRTTWTYEVTHFPVLVRAVAAGNAPLQALQVDNVFCGQQARSLKSALKWPGIRAIEVKSKGGIRQ